MRILHLLTLVTPENAYGGPATVALNQARALQDRGHRVVVAAAQRGFGSSPPVRVAGVPVRLFPARTAVPGAGYAGLGSPGLHRWLARHGRQADVVHVHLARDLVTLPAAAVVQMLRAPYVVQTHGMIARSEHPLSGPLDRVLTRRVLAGASRILCLDDRESDAVHDVAVGRVRTLVVPNGITDEHTRPGTSGPPDPPEVLFLARMHERKRPLLFAQAAARLLESHPDARFSLVGPDDGQADAVRALAALSSAPERLVWEGPVPPARVPSRMDRCAVFVLPAVDEPFGMSVLEAMARGKPVIVTRSCGLASAVATHRVGLVVPDDDPSALVDAIDRLLGDAAARSQMGRRGRRLAREEFGMLRVVRLLEDAYRDAGAATAAPRPESPRR
ncbi:glycosyltransferase [Georgenia yuyongxinii]|uniref:Glycosyltransferase n=1 Tax=Georgenia yuyongxinii TaxID=2589797 RepID=A0A5B8C045_9MICO|nr:glycosyltransferase [Georgenia yuyongxinii]QDC23903.1 glycosyltransferase [Georgenia yuyongxinii]